MAGGQFRVIAVANNENSIKAPPYLFGEELSMILIRVHITKHLSPEIDPSLEL